MAIRFRVPAEAVERVAHAYSPLLETVLSLHVLADPSTIRCSTGGSGACGRSLPRSSAT